MSNLKFADTHNLVAFLEKPTKSEGFEEIVEFLNANPIKYALTVNPKIYCPCVKQFWDTVKEKMVYNLLNKLRGNQDLFFHWDHKWDQLEDELAELGRAQKEDKSIEKATSAALDEEFDEIQA
ncbi:hypothetical protein Tco_0522775 [Tanacetum coccineum]